MAVLEVNDHQMGWLRRATAAESRSHEKSVTKLATKATTTELTRSERNALVRHRLALVELKALTALLVSSSRD